MALSQLTNLQELWLDDNVIIDPVPLGSLIHLRLLNLADNASLQCPKNGLLDYVGTLTLPAHCKSKA